MPPLPGVDAGADQTVRTQAGIHARFQQLGYRGKRCEVATVDSSHSIGGSVVVMVTGAIVGAAEGSVERRERLRRPFVLAPQEGGYYVLNDIVRFVDAGPAPPAPRAAMTPQTNNVVAAPEPPAAAPPAAPPARRAPRGVGGGGDPRANRRQETGKTPGKAGARRPLDRPRRRRRWRRRRSPRDRRRTRPSPRRCARRRRRRLPPGGLRRRRQEIAAESAASGRLPRSPRRRRRLPRRPEARRARR